MSGKGLRKICGSGRAVALVGVSVLAAGMASLARGQSCTTQAKMSPELRAGLIDAAMNLTLAIQEGSTAKVQAATISEFAGTQAFAPTAVLVKDTAAKIAGQRLRLTQIYQLDARGRKTGDLSDADFNCALAGTTSETDFSISGLPPGLYGFSMTETTGDSPWLLALLMRQDGGVWKLAGFYPRARTAAGHDGGWYWDAAYADAKAKQLWLAWVLFGEADQLLRPANFVTSTKLDSLRSEQRAATPPELADGISADNPMVLKGSDGAEFRFTSLGAEGSEDGKQLNLMVHLRTDAGANADVAKARNRAAEKALLDAHKELRQGFDRVLVFADAPGQAPLVTNDTMRDIP